MKRITFYNARASFRDGGDSGSLLKNADLILMFTMFLCGLIGGCALFNAGGIIQEIGLEHVNDLNAGSVLLLLGNAGIHVLTATALYVFCSFSSFGAALLCLLMAYTGCRFGVLASALLFTQQLYGIGVFSVLFLPGGIIFTTAELLLFTFGLEVSKKTAARIFHADDVQVHMGTYIRKTLIPTLLMAVSMVIDIIMHMLFAGILLSGV